MTNIPRKFADTRIWSSPSVMNAAGLWKGIVRVTLGCLSRVPTSPRSQLQPACHHRHHLQPACHHQLGTWETVSHPGSSGQHYYERRVQHPLQYPVLCLFSVSRVRVPCLLSLLHISHNVWWIISSPFSLTLSLSSDVHITSGFSIQKRGASFDFQLTLESALVSILSHFLIHIYVLCHICAHVSIPKSTFVSCVFLNPHLCSKVALCVKGKVCCMRCVALLLFALILS